MPSGVAVCGMPGQFQQMLHCRKCISGRPNCRLLAPPQKP